MYYLIELITRCDRLAASAHLFKYILDVFIGQRVTTENKTTSIFAWAVDISIS